MNSSCSPKNPSVKALLQWGTAELRKHDIETSRLDAEVLLAHAMDRDRTGLYFALEDDADDRTESSYKLLIKRRTAHTPVSYIIGHKEFMSLDFVVNESVLIPRPDTEILVETVNKLAGTVVLVLELGTGSGAIAVSLAKYNPDWHIVATDLSIEALNVAKENARNHGVANRISFLQGDLFEALSPSQRFDWVVSNPPYISRSDLANLPVGIKDNEPMLALDGGSDGLDVIRRILDEAWKVLKPGGQLALEMGHDQSRDISIIAKNTGKYSDCSIVEDYSRIPRVIYWNRLQI